MTVSCKIGNCIGCFVDFIDNFSWMIVFVPFHWKCTDLLKQCAGKLFFDSKLKFFFSNSRDSMKRPSYKCQSKENWEIQKDTVSSCFSFKLNRINNFTKNKWLCKPKKFWQNAKNDHSNKHWFVVCILPHRAQQVKIGDIVHSVVYRDKNVLSRYLLRKSWY